MTFGINTTRDKSLTAREITYNNFEISLVVFMPNITTNHAITYTNLYSSIARSQSLLYSVGPIMKNSTTAGRAITTKKYKRKVVQVIRDQKVINRST